MSTTVETNSVPEEETNEMAEVKAREQKVIDLGQNVKNRAANLKREITAHIENLAQLTDDAKKSEAVEEYLKFLTKFYKYSFHNAVLILIQYPDATMVAGYRKWQKDFNRYVKKGERGIKIFAPFYKKKKVEVPDPDNPEETTEEVQKVTYFGVVTVFDVAQTEGDPVPTWRDVVRVDGDTFGHFLEVMEAFAEEHGIKVNFEELKSARGYSSGGKIVIDDTGCLNQQVGTMLHEIAHELLHQIVNGGDGGKPRVVKETEAEAVAYCVCKHFGIPRESQNYLALWDSDKDILERSLEAIHWCSTKIIKHIEENLSPPPGEPRVTCGKCGAAIDCAENEGSFCEYCVPEPGVMQCICRKCRGLSKEGVGQ